MARSTISLGLALLGLVAAQKPGATPDNHPKITTYRCTNAGGCKPKTNYIVTDALSHWVHQVGNNLGCGNWGEKPNATACPTKEACAQNCVMEGISDYSQNGVTTSGSDLKLEHILDSRVVSPRVYLLDDTKENYEMIYLTGQEFTFDVDMAKLPCGMNAALYLSEMEKDGSKSALNTGGAKWGTGYCDAQCFTTPFINGEGNVEGKGACCNELDIWEANSRATHIAPHPCNVTGSYLGTAAESARDGVCDKAGCGWNPYRVGQDDYYGRGSGFKVDTTKKMTVVTQFPAENGKLKAIVRLYVQDGKVIKAETVKKDGLPKVDSMTDELCKATNSEAFMRLGALPAMGTAMDRGMVLALSIWWDAGGNMLWLDGAQNGAGPCNSTEGNPDNIVKVESNPVVTFSNMKWGEIGSTFKSSPPSCKSRRRH